ncbi:MAG: hypothetical protein WBM92_00875 [Aureibaculum sp.]
MVEQQPPWRINAVNPDKTEVKIKKYKSEAFDLWLSNIPMEDQRS